MNMRAVDKKRIIKIKNKYLIIVMVIGVTLMLINKTTALEKTSISTSENSVAEIGDFLYSESDTEMDYINYTSEKIKHCLEQMQGVGAVEVFITVEGSTGTYSKSEFPKVSGIMIVAAGAGNPVVVKDITEACEALFSLDAHKIKVVRMRGD